MIPLARRHVAINRYSGWPLSGSWISACCGLVLLVLGCPASAGEAAAEHPLAWPTLLARAAEDPGAVEAFLQAARREVHQPIWERVHRFEDVGEEGGSWLDKRALSLEPEIQETFALAMSDPTAARRAGEAMTRMAVAYRLTGEAKYRDWALDQLQEMSGWRPLQRPGWTLYKPGSRLPGDGQDGSWLATGYGIRGICNTLEIMPAGSVPDDLLAQVHELLAGEIAQVRDDWTQERQWFVRRREVTSNQWMLPIGGLVRACLTLGVDEYGDAYAFGVEQLMASLDAYGQHGEYPEGIDYSTVTLPALLSAARAMAVHGDERAIDHPFLASYPTWLAHHFQPGSMLVNAFDAIHTARGSAAHFAPFVAQLAICTGDPVARWLLESQFEQPLQTIEGLAAAGLPTVDAAAAPPLYAAYDVAARVNWRSSWDAKADGVWIRGGHAGDLHDHQDRGHVNYIADGTPLLIETGTPSYHHPQFALFKAGAGHNVLQLGAEPAPEPTHHSEVIRRPGWQEPGVVAPIAVHALTPDGGDVTVTVAEGYADLDQWSRQVQWSLQGLTVDDTVQLDAGRPQVVLLRWHLGTNESVQVVRSDAHGLEVSWPDATMTLSGDVKLVVEVTEALDHTLEAGANDHRHRVVVVRSADPVERAAIRTTVTPTR